MRTELGPDATGVGWVFQYALVDDSGQQSLADLRTFQDWTLRYRLQSVPGVAEVATFGGFQKQYQVTVDPNRLKAYGLGMMDVTRAVKQSNNEVGGRLVELSGKEYMVRGRGYVQTTADLEQHRAARERRRARRSCCATSPRWPSGRRSAAASATSTARATPSAASS